MSARALSRRVLAAVQGALTGRVAADPLLLFALLVVSVALAESRDWPRDSVEVVTREVERLEGVIA